MTGRLKSRLAVACVGLVLAACASLPSEHSTAPSKALTATADTKLGILASRGLATLKEPSGVHLLYRGPDAFLARLALADAAERSIDAQYYIWHDDTTGRLLCAWLLRAADRGVRVRMLIDDVGSAANDMNLLLLTAHPNVEVRLFNPIASRSTRLMGLLFDFSRTNRRMHNKSFTVDNQVTIVGGRNIGDEYFGARQDVNFGDLDSLTVGAAVTEVSGRFDAFWNSPVVYAIQDLTTTRPDAAAYAKARAELEAFAQQQRDGEYADALRNNELAQQLLAGHVAFSGGSVKVLADDPAKVERPDEDRSKNLMPQLMPELAGMREQVLMVSPYFVPGVDGVEKLRDLRARGIRVRVLTNSLASTDEPSVYSGYAKYRDALLDAGVELYEVNPDATRDEARRRSDAGEDDKTHGSGRSRAALHAKTLVVDCRIFFVGSMNLDPRSAFTNTEIGIVVNAPDAVSQLCSVLDDVLAKGAYRVELKSSPAGGTHVEWVSREADKEVRYTVEPKSTAWQRWKSRFYSLLPIEPLL
jgi:putative cardiolipin synthase